METVQPDRIFEAFPAPSYRGNQEAALERIRAAFAAGNRAVLVRAPTGTGKSLLARAIMGCAARAGEVDPAEPTGAYYTTPQVSQLEDVAADPLLEDLPVIRGKSNYTCVLPDEESTPVDRAPCAREAGFDCDARHRCPYFSDRAIAANRRHAATTLAYFMQTAGSDVFGVRDVVVIDEAHGLGEWAEMYATVEVGPAVVSDWGDLDVSQVADADEAVPVVERLRDRCDRERRALTEQAELDAEEVARRDRLAELIADLDWFVADHRDPGSATTWLVDQDDRGALSIKPLDPARYLRHTVWDRGQRFALLSATILEKEPFCRSVGLDPSAVALVDVEHTFPLEHRPLYDVTCGKMTYEEREDTLPDLARTLVRVMAREPGTGLVHCHSYAIQADLAARLRDMGVGGRIRTHDRRDRDAQLRRWKAAGDPEVFLSVKMEAALDLEGDLARWQVLCKAPYPNASDSRVARRLDDGQWDWYYRNALRTVIQACGRVVRSPEDRGATYVADASLLDLFERARASMPDWFAAQVDAMTAPDLPAFDPASARRETGGGGGAGSDARSGARGAGTSDSDPATGRSTRSGGTSSSADGGGRGGGSSGSSERSSPLADVWGVE